MSLLSPMLLLLTFRYLLVIIRQYTIINSARELSLAGGSGGKAVADRIGHGMKIWVGMLYNSYNERKGESLGCVGVEEEAEEIR